MARLTTKCMTSWLNNHHVPSWFYILGVDTAYISVIVIPGLQYSWASDLRA